MRIVMALIAMVCLSLPCPAVDWSGAENPLVERAAEPILMQMARAIEHQPRRVQWEVYTTQTCLPCKQAIEDFENWFAGGGWLIGQSPQAHIRLIDVSDPQAAKQHGITSVPTFRLVVDGQVIRQSGYPGRQSMLDQYQQAHRSLNLSNATRSREKPMEAIQVGTLPGRDQARELLAALKPFLGSGGELQQTLTRTNAELQTPIGPGVALYVPSDLKIRYTMTGNRLNAVFEGRKPAIRKTSGWLLAEVEIHGGSLIESEATLGLSWCPDMTIALK